MSVLCRRRRHALSASLFGFVAFTMVSMWYFNSADHQSLESTFQKLRLFAGSDHEDLPENFYKLLPDDPILLKVIRENYILYPSDLEYNLTRPLLTDFSRGQSAVIDRDVMSEKVNGFFVECGASDGEDQSVTLFFERERKWRGLLVEPDKLKYQQLVLKHRKSHVINACVRTDYENLDNPEISNKQNGYFKGSSSLVPCFWLRSLLLAMGQAKVDLISLDINGREEAFVKSLKNIGVFSLTVEVPITLESVKVLQFVQFMNLNGFNAMHQFTDHVHNTKDLVFKKKDKP